MFDDTLGEALAVQLRQSPFLNLVPDQRVQATLRMMQRPSQTRRSTDEVGRDVCQRVGARALLTERHRRLGSSYVITLRAAGLRRPATPWPKRQVQAARKEDVLRSSARRPRRSASSSASRSRRSSATTRKVELATTASLEALKAYSQALAARRTMGDRAALPLLRRAVELDPDVCARARPARHRSSRT